MKNPDPAEIQAARANAGLTQSAAGEIIFGSLRAWQDYEAGKRKMHPAIWWFFLIRTGQKRIKDIPPI